jgi:GNAT superfamily N-acetyltransferase
LLVLVWLSTAPYYAELDPGHFQVPRAEDIPGELWDNEIGPPKDDSLRLVAELDGTVIGWLLACVIPPDDTAAAGLIREQSWTWLAVDSLIVHRDHSRQGAGAALLEAAESWGRAKGAQVVRLTTYANSPVAVPFYEEHMGYQRRSIVFQKRL